MNTLPDGPWFYQQVELGFNYRMTELQAALGVSQISRLNEFVNRRHLLAERYDYLLSGLPILTPWQNPDCYSSFHLYPIRLKLEKIKKKHIQVFKFLIEKEIGVNLHYIPIYRHKYYQSMGFYYENYPHAEQYYKEAISLPIYYDLSKSQQDKVVCALKSAIE
jgi:dTDP-4-amino-4,6-dideoxygalactose transaminase